MLAIFMTTFREGLEALLIISVALAFLGKTGNRSLMTALFAGTGVAVLGSGALGIYLARHGAFSSVWEGWLALVACALIVGCIIHMQRHGKQMARQIREELAKATSRRPLLMWCSVFLFAVFMVGREGVEAATLIAALSGMETGRQLAIWATAGLGTAMPGSGAVMASGSICPCCFWSPGSFSAYSRFNWEYMPSMNSVRPGFCRGWIMRTGIMQPKPMGLAGNMASG